jgi:hypothetical protein
MNLYIGIDWSSTKHDAVITNEQKARVAMLTFPHSVAGFAQFDALRDTTGVAASDSVIGIETASTLLIDFLWDHGYDTVYIVPPLLVKTRRRGAAITNMTNRLIRDIVLPSLEWTDDGKTSFLWPLACGVAGHMPTVAGCAAWA